MPTTQSEDPNERVNHPRHYNQHGSNIECIELIEHLPLNLGNAVKYIWRCGLKQSETPMRDLKSALWYTFREEERRRVFELSEEDLSSKTDVVWRALAWRVIEHEDSQGIPGDGHATPLAMYLRAMMHGGVVGFINMRAAIYQGIQEFEASTGGLGAKP